MLEFYDKLFISVYKLYAKKNISLLPVWIGILILSLFQGINILSVLFIFFWFVFGGDSLGFFVPALLSVSALGLLFNYLRIYKLIGVQNFLERYSDCKTGETHPIMYFVISLLLLLVQGVGF
ncbi:MAG: hypothetical protein QM764_19615 [Chitinophagaceae bacterium]